MKAHHYDIAIQAISEQEADSKMKALIVLASRLNAKELQKLAQVVEHDPIKTAFAKKALGL